MKNFTVKASALAIAAALPGVASAVVNLNDGSGATNYASELLPAAVSASRVVTVTPVTAYLGFGVSNGQDRYIRFDLTGAKWNTALTASSIDGASNCGATSNAGVSGAATDALETLSTGGAVGGTSVIYQITANVAGGLGENSPVCLTATNVKLTSAAGASIKYQLYATAENAVAGGATGRLDEATGTIAGSAPGLVYSVTPGGATADVEFGYKQFTDDVYVATDFNLAGIGGIVLRADGANAADLDGTAVTLADLISGANLAVVGEDLGSLGVAGSAASNGGIYLGDNVTCAPVLPGVPVSGSPNARRIQTDLNTIDHTVCYDANGSIAIAEQAFTVALDVTPAANSAAADVAVTALGSIERNGTVLKAPFMSNAVGQYTFIQVANVSTVAADWSVACYGPSGSLGAGGSGTLPGGTTGKLAYSALGCAVGTSAVELIINAPEGNVVGTLVRQSTSGGSTGLDSLTGNK